MRSGPVLKHFQSFWILFKLWCGLIKNLMGDEELKLWDFAVSLVIDIAFFRCLVGVVKQYFYLRCVKSSSIISRFSSISTYILSWFRLRFSTHSTLLVKISIRCRIASRLVKNFWHCSSCVWWNYLCMTSPIFLAANNYFPFTRISLNTSFLVERSKTLPSRRENFSPNSSSFLIYYWFGRDCF